MSYASDLAGKNFSVSRKHTRCDISIRVDDEFTPADALRLSRLIAGMAKEAARDYGIKLWIDKELG